MRAIGSKTVEAAAEILRQYMDGAKARRDKLRSTKGVGIMEGVPSPLKQSSEIYSQQLAELRRAKVNAPEKRLARLERAVAGLQTRTQTFYQYAYARLKRRADTNKLMYQRAAKMNKLVRNMEANGPLFKRLGKIVGGVNRGRFIVTLSPQQFHRMTYLLRPQGRGHKLKYGAAGTVAVYLRPGYLKRLRYLLRKGS